MPAFPFQAVLFDMDGVVVDNMPLHREVWTLFARQHGLDPTEAFIRTLDGRRASDIVAALFGDLPQAEVEAMAHARETLYARMLGERELAEVPGVRAFLQRLGAAGIPRVLATSATRVNVDTVLSRLGLAASFEGVVTAADVTKGKPDPMIYLLAACQAGHPPAACLVVEDALPGVAAGVAAGAPCLGLGTSEPEAALRAAGATFYAPDFTNIETELGRITT